MINTLPMGVTNFMDRAQGWLPPFIQRLTATQQAIVGAGALGVLIVGIIFVNLSMQPEYAPLFNGLSPEDAGAVTARLRDAKVPYQLENGGATILVSKREVYDTRLTMASQGLPTGGRVGFEIFDKTTFGQPEFVQQLNFQRALEGELERTIGQMAGIDKPTVHLVMPKTQLFTEQQRETTAAVTLKLLPNTRLQPAQVATIRHLVASSVEGLQPKNVVIGDTSGNLLEDSKSDLGSTAVTSQLNAKRDYERGIEQAVTAILTQTLGPEKAVVRANAVMNWDQVDQQSETFSPAGLAPQPRSLRQTQENFSGQGAPPEGGIPGATTNIPGAPAIYSGAAGGQGPTDYSRQDVTSNFELSKLVEKRTPALGAVQRLSVAVMVPDTIAPAQIQSLSSLVAAAAGINEGRGDTVSVAALPLDTSKSDAADQAEKDRLGHERDMTMIKVGGALVAILLFFLGMRFIGGGVGRVGVPTTEIRGVETPTEPVSAVPAQQGLGGQALPGQETQAAVPAADVGPLGLPIPLEEQRRMEEERINQEQERIRQEQETRMSEERGNQLAQLQELAKTEPERVAEVLQIWLAEDRRGGR